MQENLKLDRKKIDKLFNSMKQLYNKKVFMDNEDFFLNTLNLNMLQKKNLINCIINIFRDDEQTVIEDNLV